MSESFLSDANPKIFPRERTRHRRKQLIRRVLSELQYFAVFPLQQKKLSGAPAHFKLLFFAQRSRFQLFQTFIADAQVSFFRNRQLCFDSPEPEPFGLNLKGAIDSFIGGCEIALHLIIENENLEGAGGRFVSGSARRELLFSF